MKKSNSIYVAGHKGMVGSAVVRKLAQEGYYNLLLPTKWDLDLRNQRAVDVWFSRNMPEYVVLAAAKVGGISWNSKHPVEFLLDNLSIQNNVIDSAARWGTKKLIFLGSSCVYPKNMSDPIKETALLTAPLEETNEAYAIAKIAGLKLCSYLRSQYEFDAVSLMPCNIYGPHDNFDRRSSHVIPSMINKFSDAMKNGEDSVLLWGDGSPLREFLYADDLADAIFFMMTTESNQDFVNVGSDDEFSIHDLAIKVARAVGYSGKILWDVEKPNGTMRKKLDTSRMDALGWRKQTSFDEGLAKTIEWYRSQSG